jgi:hypothetical protein
MKKGAKMVNKNLSFNTVWRFVVIVALLCPSITLGAEIRGAELVNLLADKDQISHSSGYKISFLIIRQHHPLHDPNQGMHFTDSEATWPEEGVFAMKMSYYYEHPPVFIPPGPAGSPRNYDYDDNGNFMIVRALEEHILSAPDRNDSLQKVRRFVVDPNGQIVRTDDSILLWRWPIDKPYSVYQFNHIQLPMGRGFSRHLGTVKSAKSLSSGLVKVTSQGSHGPGLKGTWELTIDPNSDYLVRKAVFTPDGMDKRTTLVTSSGVVEKDRIKLAKDGVLKYTNLPEYSVQVAGISKVVGPNHLYEEVLSRLSRLPPGTSTIDLRGEKPVVTTVK